MKLVSCYIEQFGCLSQYSVQFQEGITTIYAPNGSGKSTLAEFLRAMLYGFPRQSRDLDRNPRLKYLPWQGGAYGGNLVLEHEGVRYRIERTFGEKPARDTFALYDLTNNQKSNRFSQNIGTELFGLDSDSFARSTYLPQISEGGASLSTAGIHARLTALVENGGEQPNYEKAVQRLTKAKNSLDSGRSSSLAAKAQRELTRLEEDLSAAERRVPELQKTAAALEEHRIRRSALEQEQQTALEHLRSASEEAVRKSARERDGQYTARLQELQTEKEALQVRYPRGIPFQGEIEILTGDLADVAALQAKLEPSRSEQDAEQYVQEHQERFAAGLPSEEAFAACRARVDEYSRTDLSLENARLTPLEARQLSDLQQRFSNGLPDAETLAEIQNAQRKLEVLEAGQGRSELFPEEIERLKQLEALFAAGVPTREELEQKNQALRRLQNLRWANQDISAAGPVPPPEAEAEPDRRKSLPGILAIGICGLVGVVIGVMLLTGHSILPGSLLLVAGLLCLVAAILLFTRSMISQEVSSQGPRTLQEEDLEQLQKNESEILSLTHELRDFLANYFASPDNPAEQLPVLMARQQEYENLRERMVVRKNREQDSLEEMEQLEAWLDEHLSPYFPDSLPPNAALTLQVDSQTCRMLLQKEADLAKEREELSEQRDALAESIRSFLAPYCGEVAPSDFSSCLAALQQESQTYRHNLELIRSAEGEQSRSQRTLESIRKRMKNFSETYGIPMEDIRLEVLQSIRDDIRTWKDLLSREEALKREQEDYRRENQAILSLEENTGAGDLAELRGRHEAIMEEITQLNSTIAAEEQQIQTLQEETDRIPVLEDARTRRKEVLANARRNAELLGVTLEALKTARGRLSESYLAPVQSRFYWYLQQLSSFDPETFSIENDLSITLDSYGKLHPMGHLSTGQSDLMLLCMRFALVDALFQDARPFLILDDPFINLDDRSARVAMELLRTMSKDTQILYLVCHSSRTIPEA